MLAYDMYLDPKSRQDNGGLGSVKRFWAMLLLAVHVGRKSHDHLITLK